MAKYKLVNQNDGNDEVEVGDFEEGEEIAAYVCAVNTLGWSLVKEDNEEGYGCGYEGKYDVGETIRLNIGQGLHTGTGVIADITKEPEDTNFVFRIEQIIIDDICKDKDWTTHCEDGKTLWINEFEIVNTGD